MSVKRQGNPLAEWADVLPPRLYRKPELRRAYFDFLAGMLVIRFLPQAVLDVGFSTSHLVTAFRRLSIQDNRVDIVTALEVLEHVRDFVHCISEAKLVLRPGGVVFMTTPSPIPLVSPVLHSILRRDKCEVHVNEHNKGRRVRQFRQAGFSYAQNLIPAIKKWLIRHGFFWELPFPAKLFLRLGYQGRLMANELYSLFSCVLLFRKPERDRSVDED